MAEMKKYYFCECKLCGWRGSSQFAVGGHSIADTGDYDDIRCPICGSSNIDDEVEMNGAECIAAERKRQIEEEGFTAEHDNRLGNGVLAAAAACYAVPALAEKAYLWPFDRSWWKLVPENRIRELEKAGALIAAEIDRLQLMEKNKRGSL
jgi:hypothetical protein